MEGQIEAARTRIDYAKSKLVRVEDLEQKQFVAAQARDDIKAELRLAKAELQAALEARDLARLEHRRAQAELELRTLKSPFDGVVIDRMLDPGELAESGSGRKAVLKIAQTNPLRIDVVLPATLFGHIRGAQLAHVKSAVGAGTYTAEVDTVDQVIDAASGTFVVRLTLPNPDLSVPIGSRCTAEFDSLATTSIPRPDVPALVPDTVER
jgi:multidrug efflux pump subunit AcrA (membrane-fusion protein)